MITLWEFKTSESLKCNKNEMIIATKILALNSVFVLSLSCFVYCCLVEIILSKKIQSSKPMQENSK